MPTREPDPDFCSTVEAAALLGISKRTAQLWVESGILAAWKTVGGHRRISRTSVAKLLEARPPVPGNGASTQPSSPPPPAGASERRPHVLVVEDDEIYHDLYRTMLARWALKPEVRIAVNGFDALLRIGLERPDLLITDMDMPGMDGFQMLRAIKAAPELVDLDIIVVTGLSPEDISAHQGIPDDVPVLHKPIRFERLEYMVEAALARRAARRALPDPTPAPL